MFDSAAEPRVQATCNCHDFTHDSIAASLRNQAVDSLISHDFDFMHVYGGSLFLSRVVLAHNFHVHSHPLRHSFCYSEFHESKSNCHLHFFFFFFCALG